MLMTRFPLLLAPLLILGACNASPNGDATDSTASNSAATTPSSTRVDLTGAGATFPYPLYSRWFNEYATLANVRINYQSIGSGGGIRQVVARTVDFGATDVPMSDAELASAGMPVLHIPTVIGAVAITYNLPGVTRPLQLSPDIIAGIFLQFRVDILEETTVVKASPRIEEFSAHKRLVEAFACYVQSKVTVIDKDPGMSDAGRRVTRRSEELGSQPFAQKRCILCRVVQVEPFHPMKSLPLLVLVNIQCQARRLVKLLETPGRSFEFHTDRREKLLAVFM